MLILCVDFAKKMDQYLKEIERLQRLHDEVCTDEENEYEDSDPESDVDLCEQSNHDSESEESADEVRDEEIVDEQPTRGTNRHLFYISKNGTKWAKHAPSTSVRTRRQNIVIHLPGAKGTAKNLVDPLQCWSAIFTNDMLDIIVQNTNIFIQKNSANYKDQSDVKPTNIVEIKALIGMLYLMGLYKSGRKNTKDFWAEDGSGIEIIRATMAHRRFTFLLYSMRFDNIHTRDQRKETDKFCHIRDIFEMFVQNSKNCYTPGEYLTLDEMLFKFRGRCSFRMYIPSKPARYGIKVFALADARTCYVTNLEVYLGANPGPYEVSNSAADVVKRMCTPIYNTGRNVTMDNWFTSLDIVLYMLENHRVTIVGTIRKNKREIPSQFLDIKPRKICSSMFGFQKNVTLVSYVPKKSKVVLAMSSMHFDDKIDPATGEKFKPDIITYYNVTKCGVDLADQKMAAYNVSRSTRRWPMVIFYNLLNIAGINAHVICQSNSPDETNQYKERRLFLKKLSFDLVKENMKIRSTNPRIRKDIRHLGLKLCGTSASTVRARPETTHGRCEYCRNRKTRFFCQKCYKWLCLEHIQPFCADCIDEGTDN